MPSRKDESIKRIHDGKFRIGPAPYGYELVDGRLFVIPGRAEAVCLMFDMHDAGVSTREIAKVLTSSGYQTPSGKTKTWGHKMVAIILNRRAFYAGETSMINGIMWTPERGTVMHPRILGWRHGSP